MTPEYANEEVYEEALASSPILKTIFEDGMQSEEFAQATRVCAEKLGEKYPDLEDREFDLILQYGFSLGVFPYPTEDEYGGINWGEAFEKIKKGVGILFMIGYELGSPNRINVLFDDILEIARERGFLDDSDIVWENADAGYLDIVLRTGLRLRERELEKPAPLSTVTTPPTLPKIPKPYDKALEQMFGEGWDGSKFETE